MRIAAGKSGGYFITEIYELKSGIRSKKAGCFLCRILKILSLSAVKFQDFLSGSEETLFTLNRKKLKNISSIGCIRPSGQLDK